jgi:hypothetical protein
VPEWPFAEPRTTATLVKTERASQVHVTGGICVNQASKPTTGRDNLEVGVARDEAGYTSPVAEGTLTGRTRACYQAYIRSPIPQHRPSLSIISHPLWVIYLDTFPFEMPSISHARCWIRKNINKLKRCRRRRMSFAQLHVKTAE